MIIDASVAFKWIAAEEGTDRAMALLANTALSAPYLLLSEVGNGLRKQIAAGQLASAAPFARELGRLATLVTLVDERADVPVALELAAEISHSIYDCVYLAMAIRMEIGLITADAKFVRKLGGTRYADRVLAL